MRAGEAIADPARDLAKIAVIERHLATGRIGLGFVRGFGLQRGALASTVAHDAHNVVVVGTSDAAMAFAVRRLANLGGGIVAVDGVAGRRRAAAAGRRAALGRAARGGRRAEPRAGRGGARARLHGRGAVPAARVPGAVGDPEPEAHRPRPRRRRPLRARAAGDRMILANAWIVTMDDAARARARLAADRGRLIASSARRPAASGMPRRSTAPQPHPGWGGPPATRQDRGPNGRRRKTSFATRE